MTELLRVYVLEGISQFYIVNKATLRTAIDLCQNTTKEKNITECE